MERHTQAGQYCTDVAHWKASLQRIPYIVIPPVPYL